MSPVKIKYTEEELVGLLKSRSKEAFEYLYDNYSSALFGIASKIVNSEEIAEDILQDAFVKIWNNIQNYNSEKGRLFTWLLNITRNTAIDHIRSLRFRQDQKNQKIENTVGIIDSNFNTVSKVDHIGLKEAVQKLRPEYVTIIEMSYFKGYTQEEISNELNIPLGTVKTRCRAALNELRSLMEVR